ncbi:ribonuclease D [Candidatus Sneabacter namystus]|uniref:Ribonuclease D n=1 Tax=Candidatus Sneabacter namystus TaxID=2601646 RepID=A0A5C0UHH1_9RICK|nr:ribonuclease H-like domain-containing protein [Candidatus Sneabacter namystus]QEK39568.1 ribonuclease D [Candidatus Sneabacter namystus]
MNYIRHKGHSILLVKNDIPEDLQMTGDIAIDTEAMGLSFARDRLCVVQLCDENRQICLIQFDKDQNYEAPNLKKLLCDTNRTMIFHFARFDLAIIQHYLGINIKQVFCTKIASRMARTYTESHSLRELCRELLGIQISKQQQTSDWGKDNLSKEQIAYAANDVLYLHEIRKILSEMLIRENRTDLTHDIFQSLKWRIKLDLMGWHNNDIFAYSEKNKQI